MKNDSDFISQLLSMNMGEILIAFIVWVWFSSHMMKKYGKYRKKEDKPHIFLIFPYFYILLTAVLLGGLFWLYHEHRNNIDFNKQLFCGIPNGKWIYNGVGSIGKQKVSVEGLASISWFGNNRIKIHGVRSKINNKIGDKIHPSNWITDWSFVDNQCTLRFGYTIDFSTKYLSDEKLQNGIIPKEKAPRLVDNRKVEEGGVEMRKGIVEVSFSPSDEKCLVGHFYLLSPGEQGFGSVTFAKQEATGEVANCKPLTAE